MITLDLVVSFIVLLAVLLAIDAVRGDQSRKPQGDNDVRKH